jgi:hypothetical protein
VLRLQRIAERPVAQCSWCWLACPDGAAVMTPYFITDEKLSCKLDMIRIRKTVIDADVLRLEDIQRFHDNQNVAPT